MENKSIIVSAPGRIDLSGGATDWCGMHTLSMAINLRAYVRLTKLTRPKQVHIKIGDLEEVYTKPKYGTELDLFKAVIELSKLSGFKIEYSTQIPRGSGLGGSAPLTVATLFALNSMFDRGWNLYYIAELAQRAETLKLKTVNGYQDQYTAAFGGLLFLDFNGKSCQKGKYSQPVEKEPYTAVERLDKYQPEFHTIIAIPKIKRASSNQTNSRVSERYLAGEAKIVALMNKKARLTQEAKKKVVNHEMEKLYKIINLNNAIMRKFGFVSEDNERIIAIANKHKALATKTCGAGWGAVAVFAKDQNQQNKIMNALKDEVVFIRSVKPAKGVRFEKKFR